MNVNINKMYLKMSQIQITILFRIEIRDVIPVLRSFSSSYEFPRFGADEYIVWYIDSWRWYDLEG